MQIARVLSLVVLLVGSAGVDVAVADQSDPRLDPLFDQLKAAAGPEEEQSLEQQIWTIWLEAPNPEVQTILDDGVAAMNLGDYATALNYFNQVIELAPDYAEGWNKRATLHYLLGNYQESLDDIVETLAREPRHFGALSGRGLVYFQMDELQEALSAFEETLDVSPQMVGPRANAEAIRRALGQRGI